MRCVLVRSCDGKRFVKHCTGFGMDLSKFSVNPVTGIPTVNSVVLSVCQETRLIELVTSFKQPEGLFDQLWQRVLKPYIAENRGHGFHLFTKNMFITDAENIILGKTQDYSRQITKEAFLITGMLSNH